MVSPRENDYALGYVDGNFHVQRGSFEKVTTVLALWVTDIFWALKIFGATSSKSETPNVKKPWFLLARASGESRNRNSFALLLLEEGSNFEELIFRQGSECAASCSAMSCHWSVAIPHIRHDCVADILHSGKAETRLPRSQQVHVRFARANVAAQQGNKKGDSGGRYEAHVCRNLAAGTNYCS